MWTYLLIFLGTTALLGIFVWRAFLYFRGVSPLKKTEAVSTMVEEKVPPRKKLLKEQQMEVDALLKKAESKLKVGKEEEAIKCFVQALAIDEAHLDAQHKLAMLYMQKQLYSAAAALFKSLGESTNDAVHYSHLGLALYNQNLHEEARDAYQRAVDLDPSRPQRFSSLAQVYRSLGQLQNAVIALSKAVELEPENVDFLFFLADLHKGLGGFDSAMTAIERVAVIDPKNKEVSVYMRAISKAKRESESGA